MSNNTSIFLQSIIIHDSWTEFFHCQYVQEELHKVERIIGNNYTPSANHVLRFATVDLQNIKCIVLGKDPYPQANVATGRSFEVNDATSWFDTRVNSSLKNMVKLIHKTYTDRKFGATIDEVRVAIQEGSFPIPPPDQAFIYWEEQGALFLNTTFTCEVGDFENAGSHVKHWKPFFILLLEYIAKQNPNIKYFLWGYAKKYTKKLTKLGVPKNYLYLGKHPCTNGDIGGYKNGANYMNCPCFHDTKEFINWVYPN